MLTLLDIGGHQYSCFPPHSDEGLEICFADPPLAAEAVRHQVAALDPTSNCLSRYLHVLCRLLYGEQGGEGMFRLNASIIAHVVLLRGWVGGKSLYWGEDPYSAGDDSRHSWAALRASRRTRASKLSVRSLS